MPIEILMPALSPTMTEGNLAAWHKKVGDKVKAGDVIAEIETDKATMEVEAVDEGRIGRILVDAGTEGVAVNTPIAVLLEEDEDDSALDAAPEAAQGKASETAQETASKAPADRPEAEASDEPKAPASDEPKTPVEQPRAADGGRIFASPLARRMAAEAGLDLGSIEGSGPNGRIVKADVEAAIAAGGRKAAPAAEPRRPAADAPAAPAPAAAPAAAAAGPDARAFAEAAGLPYTEIKASSMRKVIARRLTESKQTVPHFYLTIDCELDALLALRQTLNAKLGDRGKLSVNDLVIKAAAVALRQVPAANAAWAGDAILQFERVDISVAVATPGGLITPIVKSADEKGLLAISNEMKDLAGRARDGKLKPEEFQGGTFSVSNLGMYGIRHFEAIINPPQGCILAVGAGEKRAVVKNDALAIATVMSCTLAVDHRVVDGALGSEYMAAFKALIEDPMGLLL